MTRSLNGERHVVELLVGSGKHPRGVQSAWLNGFETFRSATFDPTTEVGPLIHQRHFDKVKSYFSLATEDGAEITVGGHALDSDGYFIEPTLFTQAEY